MKRMLALMMAMVLCVSMLAACGGSEKKAGDAAGETAQEEEIKGEVFDAGNVSAFVPEGWAAFPVADMWSDDEDAMDPDQVQICKDAKSEWDLFSKPYIAIMYYGEDTDLIAPDSSWYEEAEDIEDIKLSNLTWKGFTAVSLDMPMAILWADDGAGNQYEVTIYLKTAEAEIALDDADVLAILESIKPSK
jgi:hypothetical protein